MKVLVLALLSALLLHTIQASTPRMPMLHVVTSEGRYFFVMKPADYEERDGEFIETTPASGTAYMASESGEFKQMWSISGWYAHSGDVFLSPDGRTLIQIRGREDLMGQDGKFPEAEPQHVMAIYRDGKEVAKYMAKDLISDFKKGTVFWPYGGLGFSWVDREARFSLSFSGGDIYSEDIVEDGKKVGSFSPIVFHLQTREGTRFEFDLKTGKILGKKEKEPEESGDPDKNPFEE